MAVLNIKTLGLMKVNVFYENITLYLRIKLKHVPFTTSMSTSRCAANDKKHATGNEKNVPKP